MLTLVLLNCLFLFFICLKLKLLIQFLASKVEKKIFYQFLWQFICFETCLGPTCKDYQKVAVYFALYMQL